MESKQKTLYMSRQLIEFNHIYKEFNDVYREAATKVGLSLSGFDILKNLQERKYTTPIIVYSQATQREAVVQALTLGAKSYLVKPQKPEAIIQKAVEVLHSQI